VSSPSLTSDSLAHDTVLFPFDSPLSPLTDTSGGDPLSPLTDIPDDEELDAFANDTDSNHPNNQEDIFIINTNFNPYLKENRAFPCGRSDEEREDFTKWSREHVEKHAVTPSTLEELVSLVRLSFQIIFIVTDYF
jgi:hypothetical protein